MDTRERSASVNCSLRFWMRRFSPYRTYSHNRCDERLHPSLDKADVPTFIALSAGLAEVNDYLDATWPRL